MRQSRVQQWFKTNPFSESQAVPGSQYEIGCNVQKQEFWVSHHHKLQLFLADDRIAESGHQKGDDRSFYSLCEAIFVYGLGQPLAGQRKDCNGEQAYGCPLAESEAYR